jgi:hypothetical protein
MSNSTSQILANPYNGIDNNGSAEDSNASQMPKIVSRSLNNAPCAGNSGVINKKTVIISIATIATILAALFIGNFIPISLLGMNITPVLLVLGFPALFVAYQSLKNLSIPKYAWHILGGLALVGIILTLGFVAPEAVLSCVVPGLIAAGCNYFAYKHFKKQEEQEKRPSL